MDHDHDHDHGAMDNSTDVVCKMNMAVNIIQDQNATELKIKIKT